MLDARNLHDKVRDAFDEAGITPWKKSVDSIVENIITAVVCENRYYGERELEKYLIRHGFDQSYETVQLVRSLHEYVETEMISTFRLLFSSIAHRYSAETQSLLLICSDTRIKPAVLPSRYPDEGDEMDETNIPHRISQLLRSLKK